MTNTRIIDALEECKKILIDEIRRFLEKKKNKKFKCFIHLPIYTDDTYGLDGYWSENTVKAVYIDKETNEVMVHFTDDREDFDDSLNDCFNVGEIAAILDGLN